MQKETDLRLLKLEEAREQQKAIHNMQLATHSAQLEAALLETETARMANQSAALLLELRKRKLAKFTDE